MKTRFRNEQDEWSKNGNKINLVENLEKIRQVLEESPIIVERWFYRGASSPERIIFEDYEDYENYMNSECYAGDSIYIWKFSEVCKDANTIVSGKCPDENGEIPKSGAY